MKYSKYAVAILATFITSGIPGCSPSPCCVISKQWTCNLAVVEPLQPGNFVYVQNGQLQRLAGGAAGFTTTTQPTNIESATGNSKWDFKISAGLDLPTKLLNLGALQPTTNPTVTLEDAGATNYSLSFSNTTVSSLAPVANTDPIKDYQEAVHRGQQYLDAITPVQRANVGAASKQAVGGQVYLITETLNSAVDYTFTGSGNFNANGAATIRNIAGNITGSVANGDTKTIQFTNPLSIGYHALLLAVTPSQLQGATQVGVQDTKAYATLPKH